MTWARGSTRESRKARALVLAAHPLCHLRGPACTLASTEDDHVVPLSQGGTDHLSNRRGACHTCHRAKSQAEARAGTARLSRRRTVPPSPGLL